MYHDYYDTSADGLRNPYDPEPARAPQRPRLVLLGLVGAGLATLGTGATTAPALTLVQGGATAVGDAAPDHGVSPRA